MSISPYSAKALIGGIAALVRPECCHTGIRRRHARPDIFYVTGKQGD
ncbi:MAG: hypothetical protein QOK02_222 [Mycobacterium sp.]|nr:hypothetical protein [Mycobacterium sp.]